MLSNGFWAHGNNLVCKEASLIVEVLIPLLGRNNWFPKETLTVKQGLEDCAINVRKTQSHLLLEIYIQPIRSHWINLKAYSLILTINSLPRNQDQPNS